MVDALGVSSGQELVDRLQADDLEMVLDELERDSQDERPALLLQNVKEGAAYFKDRATGKQLESQYQLHPQKIRGPIPG